MGSQDLYLGSGGSDKIFLDDDSKTLRSYGVSNGMEIHVMDTDPDSLSRDGALENLNTAQRYVMDDETYDKRPNTVRAWLRQQKQQQQQAAASDTKPSETEAINSLSIKLLDSGMQSKSFVFKQHCEQPVHSLRGLFLLSGF